jgi:hypothetical protein
MLASYDDQSNIGADVLEKIMGLEKVDASIFEFNGSVTVSVSDALKLSVTEGDILYAYVDGDLRGSVLAVKSPYSQEYLFPIMLHSNIDFGEFVNFKLLKADSELIEFNEGVEFNNDMMVGNALTPFLLSSVNYGIASRFEVSHAYPNPFNPSTVIQFTIPVEMDVNVDIVNMQGRLIETLIDKHLLEGYHNVIWNASGHASGVYFVKLNIGGEISVQKLMLMK